MTTKQAIHLLHRLQDEQFDGIHGDERREALSMAVRVLSGDGDTIYRQDVLKILSSKNAAWDAYDKVKQLPSAQPHWIPCSERLPERGTSILMASRQGWVAEGEYKGVLDGRHLWIEYRWSASLSDGEIIAWMPLPEPYRGE